MLGRFQFVQHIIVAAVVTCGMNALGQALSCSANGYAINARGQGLTEATGDYLLQCTGGTPTAAGAPVPVYNITLSFNANVTSRIVGGVYVNALLLIDDPWPASPVGISNYPRPANAPSQGVVCESTATASSGSCNYLLGTGGGAFGSASSPYLQRNAATIYVGQQTAANQVTWQGVPIDPPGPSGMRLIRLTNLRANASMLGPSGTIVPTQIVGFAAINGTPAIPVSNPQRTLAFLQSGLNSTDGYFALCGCDSQNAALLTGGTTSSFDATMKVTEPFATAWRRRNIGLTVDGPTPPAVYDQNVPGYAYNTESDFMPNPAVGSPVESGTRIRLIFRFVPWGVHVFVPTTVLLTGGSPMEPPSPIPAGIQQAQLQLVTADQNGASSAGYTAVQSTAMVGSTPVAEARFIGRAAYATYEVVNSDFTSLETANIPVAFAFANVGTQSSTIIASASLAPTSSVGTASSGPIPRFNAPFVPPVGAGDIDNNGLPDLFWQNDATGQVYLWFLAAGQGIGLQGSSQVGGAAPGWNFIGAADFNGDGRPDFIWQNSTSGQIYIWYMGGPSGTTYLGSNPIGGAAPGWSVVGVADFDGDGHPDLIWQNTTSRQVYVWYMGGADGTTYQGSNPIGGAAPGWTVVGAADFNGDGHPDLIWQNDTSGQVFIWYMGGSGGTTYLGSNPIGGAAAGWSVVGATDFDGNGRPDLVWQNDTTREVSVWFMRGPQGTTYGDSLSISGPEPGWKAVARFW